MSSEPTVIYSAANTQQAYLVKGLLEERGIAAWVINDAIQIAGGELPLGWTAAARVVVGNSDAVKARQVAVEFDRQTAQGPRLEGSEAEPATSEWAEWPRCPACGERRAARCPVCGVGGTEFPLADIQETADGQRVFLICEACDDHFLPEWYRLCHRCGRDYGAGLAVEKHRVQAGYNLRVALIVLLVLAGTLVFMAYFAWLFAR